MALIEINKNPSRRELLWFGALFALFFGLIGGLIWWKLGAPLAASVLWSVAGGITLLYYALSPIRRTLYLGWMFLVFPIGPEPGTDFELWESRVRCLAGPGIRQKSLCGRSRLISSAGIYTMSRVISR